MSPGEKSLLSTLFRVLHSQLFQGKGYNNFFVGRIQHSYGAVDNTGIANIKLAKERTFYGSE